VALTHLAMSLLGAVVPVTVAVTAYDLRLPAHWPTTLLALLLAAVSTVATGFLLGSVMPTVRTTQAVAGAVHFPRSSSPARCSRARRCPSRPGGSATSCP
jgi:ABC-type polysaccharide/polyol phosphate export permease